MRGSDRCTPCRVRRGCDVVWSWLDRPERVAEHFVVACARLAGGSCEGVGWGADGSGDEPCGGDGVGPLVERESAGDAVGPQFDVAAGGRWDALADGDVGELDHAAGPQGAERFA